MFDNAIVWRVLRTILDITCGLYKNRFQKLFKEWKIKKDCTVLDIGCGIGQYSNITSSKYLGVDLNSKYIEYCKKKFTIEKNKSFRCENVTTLLNEKIRYDIVIMVDFLHHIPDDLAKKVLKTAAELSNQYIISFEPILEQDNFIGRCIINNDRGNYIRSSNDLQKLFDDTGCKIIDSVDLKLGPLKSRAILASSNKNQPKS